MPETSAEIMTAEDHWQIPTYTHMPIAVVRGKGSYVENAEGDRYLDLYGGHCVALVGHSHPTLVQAIREQADKLLFYSNVVYNDARARAAAAVTSIAPEACAVCSSATVAPKQNEAALKIARKHTGRSHVVSMVDDFTAVPWAHWARPDLTSFAIRTGPVSTDHTRIPYGDLPALQSAMGKHVAAVMLEPIPSMGGIRVADKQWFSKLRELCGHPRHAASLRRGPDRIWPHGDNLLWRTDGITPDIITAAKGVAGGVPAGLALIREDISDAVELGDQGTTFGGGPLASAAMEAVISILREENLPANAAHMERWFQDRVGSIPGVSRVSGRGLLLGIDLDRPAKPNRGRAA